MRTQTQTSPRSPVVQTYYLAALVLVACSSPPPDVDASSRRTESAQTSVWCPQTSFTVGADAGTTDECPVEMLDAGLPDSGADAGTETDAGTEEPDSGTLETMQLNAAGLWTNPNPLGQQRPAGALDVADDIVIDQPGTASIRRADTAVTFTGTDPGVLNQGWDYGGYMFAWSAESGELSRAASGASINWVSVSNVATASPSLRLPHATSAGDLYVLSNAGPYVLDGATATPAVPGVPRALDPDPGLVGNIVPSASGFMAAGDVTAYRIVIGINDAEGRPVLGSPSGRLVVTNATAGAANTITGWLLPSGLTTSHFIALYRTQTVASGIDPGDSMGKVYERALTASEIVGPPYPLVTLTDIVPDALIGEPLYTNPDRGGIRNDNARPPLAEDLAPFRNRLWLANTTGLQRFTLRFIGIPDDLDTIIIGGRTYTASYAFSDPATNKYFVQTSGTVSENIAVAARNLAAIISLDSGGSLNAYYTSGPYDAPGILVIEERTLGASAFTVDPSTTGTVLVPTGIAAISSVADTYPNRLHYSKDGLPYAFPLTNTLQVGAQEHGISRIVALRDALLVFKERGGDGLWKVTPSGAGWYVEQVNSSVQLVSPDALTVVDNTVFAITEDGMVAVTEAGVEDIDVPIEDQINTLMLEYPDALPYVKVFGREALGERKVYFGFPTISDNFDGTDYMSTTYVYNLNTETWTKDTRLWQGAYVNSAGRMVRFTDIQTPLSQTTFLERNSGDALADRLNLTYDIAWNVETAQNPGAEKQFYQAAVLTQQAQPASVDVDMYFTADDGVESSPVATGGDGSNYIRAEVPWDRQRTSRLRVRLAGTVTQPINIVGLSTTYRQYGGSLVGR